MQPTQWNIETAKKYMGDFQDTYFGYSLLEPIRENAASGGITSTLVIAALRENLVDGALLCRSVVKNNLVNAEHFIARSERDIHQSQGSKYISTQFARNAIPLIRDFKGRLAVVCLPCEARILHFLRQKDREINQKIKLVITLFCGHASEKELTNIVLDKLNPDKKQIRNFRYRSGHWRGDLTIDFQDGTQISKPFSAFSDYQNLFFFSEKKCLQCGDHTGIFSDISIGDIWSLNMKNNPIKHNAILVRSDSGASLVETIRQIELAHVFQVPAEKVCRGQSRSLLLHAAVNARAKAAASYGIKINPISNESPSLLELIIAKIVLHNYFFSHQPESVKKISHLPHSLLKLYLYFFKAFQLFQRP